MKNQRRLLLIVFLSLWESGVFLMPSPNPIFIDPTEDASSEILCLGEYYTTENPKFKSHTFSKLILDIKTPRPQQMNLAWRQRNMVKAVEYFRKQLDPLLAKGFPIAIVPPSYSGPNRSGLPSLARRLAANDRIDASQCLIRHTDKPAQHVGGSRSLISSEHKCRNSNPCP